MNRPKAGIGFVDEKDSFQAGKQAATRAMQHLGEDKSSLILAFCTGKHDYQRCFDGITSVTGSTPVIGGAGIGVIVNDHLGYEGYQLGVAALPSDITFDVASTGNLDKGEKEAGLKLGAALATKRNPDEQLMLLFYDSIKTPPPPMPIMNVSSYLLEGFEKGLGPNPITTIGAGLVGGYDFAATKQFCIDKINQQSAVGALMSGACSTYATIMHGCKPIGDYHTITRIKGPIVYEIDGKPALFIIDELFGSEKWRSQLPLILVTLGVNHGDKYGPYDETHYVNRLITGVDEEEKAIILFEADFDNNTEFQFMRRNTELMHTSARKGSERALQYLKENNCDPFFALYIDCAGRTAAYSGGQTEEAAIVQQTIGVDIPLLGFYSGVEIAPLLGKNRGLDWTGVLLILSRDKQ